MMLDPMAQTALYIVIAALMALAIGMLLRQRQSINEMTDTAAYQAGRISDLTWDAKAALAYEEKMCERLADLNGRKEALAKANVVLGKRASEAEAGVVQVKGQLSQQMEYTRDLLASIGRVRSERDAAIADGDSLFNKLSITRCFMNQLAQLRAASEGRKA